MVQEIESHLVEEVHVMVNHKTILRQYFEDLFKMSSLFLLVSRCNEYAIEIGEHRGDALQDVIHQPLKHLSSVIETEWHPQEFEQAKGGDDCNLVNVLRCHWNMVKTLLKVDLGEGSASIQVGIKIQDMMDMVSIIGCRAV